RARVSLSFSGFASSWVAAWAASYAALRIVTTSPSTCWTRLASSVRFRSRFTLNNPRHQALCDHTGRDHDVTMCAAPFGPTDTDSPPPLECALLGGCHA